MSISFFYLPSYKDMTHVSTECYLDGKACSCHGNELEEFKPIWQKIISGKFPGSIMKLKKRIRDEEYSLYPIVFISSEWWPAVDDKKAHGSTCVHIVQQQRQNLANCKSYENRYIDRETGVIILEKTEIHGDAKEPDFKYWFYEKDTRPELPKEILKEEFSEYRKNNGVYICIEKLADLPVTSQGCEPVKVNMDEYENKYVKCSGYINGQYINKLVEENVSASSPIRGFKLIDCQSSWNFVISDYYGHKVFKVNNEDAMEFIKRNELVM